jgi:hypothetical protein
MLMATRDGGAAGGRAKPKFSPARNVVAVVLLVAFAAVAYLEWNANRQSGAAIARLSQALARDEDGGDLLTKEQVEGMIGRRPDGPGVEQDGATKVTYTWKGVIRKYPLTTFYTKQDPPKLLRIE